MSVVSLPDRTLFAIAEQVAVGLSSAQQTTGGVFINTPLTYPSGTSVVVRIDGAKRRFFVSDVGLGYQESMMLNASNSYAYIARQLIADTGVSFDSRSFFVAEAEPDDLVPVVAAVANFSTRAVIETSLRHEAQKVDRDRELLIRRLGEAFGRGRVATNVTVRGSSSLEWEVAARTDLRGVVTLFDHAKPHKGSVTSIVAKFHDIARLSAPPRRVVGVRSRIAMGDFVGLLSQAANVVDLTEIPDEALVRLAA